ncbi:phage tail tape measure protein [Glaesserella parasuis]|uniref:phage tail tape measure protein n=2 Tax=Glaesserella parasuis TaxID=738 RepID=UPI002436A134|nr:phage tail tape measure protein [Glaesserella parasuis]MDG6856805.1 phage tail tape measure protein [Glaesserella parasuis]MDO9734529.1 phage tail tape measure protein [Glaesserella parasuis]MDO9794268.1 phage tail tape measure protein [Glaesserella parasuis]
MAKDMKVQLELSAKDNASQVISKVGKEAEKAFKDAEQAAVRSSQTQVNATEKVATATQSSNKRIEQAYREARKSAADLARARETLGIRSENAIQQEIRQTRAAYEQLKRSGVASQNELRRASEQTKQRIKELNAELGKSSFGDKAANVGRGLMSVGAGVAAGAMVTAPKMMQAADYDMALARVADTGYSGGTIEEKTKGKEKVHQAIKSSITQYGGTKEDALSAINELMAQGKVKVEEALELLPVIQKNATATGASSHELTNMVNSMLGAGIKKEEIQIALDYMNASGKAGGFELKDMAQYFPQLLASSGADSLDDLKKMGVQLQQVYGVSGGASETATNLTNFYSKVKASSTAKNIENIEFTDQNGKKKSIDMSKSMQHYIKQGQNASEALLSIISDVLENDTEYQGLLKQYHSAQNGEKKALMKKVYKYVEGTKVAEIMPDLQAGLAVYGMLNDTQGAENVNQQYKIAEKGNYNQESFDWISKQSGFAFQVAKNTNEMTQLENFQKVNDMAAEVAKRYSEFAQDFPNLHSALVASTDAVWAFGAALAALRLLDLLRGGKGGKSSAIGSVIETVATKGKGGLKVGAGGLGFAAVGLGLYGAAEGYVPYMARQEAEKEKRAEAEKKFREQHSSKPSAFTYGNAAMGGVKPEHNYHGAYVIAGRLNDNKIAQERVKQGSLSEAEMKSRLERNQAIIDGEVRPSVEATTGALSNYQADFQAFGQSISMAIEAGLTSQSHTLANNITLEVDGRVLAEYVSNEQFNFNKRVA